MSPDVKGIHSIRNHIKTRLKDWRDGKFDMLMSITTLFAVALMKKKRGHLSTSERAKIFTSLLSRGKMKEATRLTCYREKGGVLLTDGVEEKSGSCIKDALRSKHPDGKDVDLKDTPECL